MAPKLVIGEFAVNPACVQSRTDLRDILNIFGFEHGAVISNFPNGWHREIADKAASLQEPERSSFLNRLKQVKERVVAHLRPSEPGITWMDQVATAQGKRPFYAVLTDANTAYGRLFSDAMDDPDLRKGLREQKVPRRPEELIRSFLPLVLSSDRFTIVDPYLAPDPYHGKFVKTLLEARRTIGNNLLYIDLHIEFDSNPAEQRDASVQCENDFRAWGQDIGNNVIFNVYWWEDRGIGELHPRYLLTDRGGVRLDRGARIPPELDKQYHDTDICMLTDDFVREIERRYSGIYQPLMLKHRFSFRTLH